MPITKYSEEYCEDLTVRFLAALKRDKRTLIVKLQLAYLPKGTYSHLLHRTAKRPAKTTLESMRAYLENRPPKFTLVKPGEAYCYFCEDIFPKDRFRDPWTCIVCKNKINYACKLRTGFYERYKRDRYAKFKVEGPARQQFLEKRSNYYAETRYGKLGKCVQVIRKIKKEIKDAQET